MSIKLLVMDVDGTLTDGQVYIGEQGEIMKAFDVKDGYGILQCEKLGIEPVIITGRNSLILEHRAKELGITELYQGVKSHKIDKLRAIAKQFNCTANEIAYIGDDENDLECIQYCGTSGCPSDAVDKVKKHVTYVCNRSGGHGAVREFIETFVQW